MAGKLYENNLRITFGPDRFAKPLPINGMRNRTHFHVSMWNPYKDGVPQDNPPIVISKIPYALFVKTPSVFDASLGNKVFAICHFLPRIMQSGDQGIYSHTIVQFYNQEDSISWMRRASTEVFLGQKLQFSIFGDTTFSNCIEKYSYPGPTPRMGGRPELSVAKFSGTHYYSSAAPSYCYTDFYKDSDNSRTRIVTNNGKKSTLVSSKDLRKANLDHKRDEKKADLRQILLSKSSDMESLPLMVAISPLNVIRSNANSSATGTNEEVSKSSMSVSQIPTATSSQRKSVRGTVTAPDPFLTQSKQTSLEEQAAYDSDEDESIKLNDEGNYEHDVNENML